MGIVKKTFLSILSVCLLLQACKKEKKPTPVNPQPPVVINPTAKKYATVWHLAVEKDTIGSISAADSGITNYYFIVYDSLLNEVGRIHRYANNPGTEISYINGTNYASQASQLVNINTTNNFYTVTDSLPPGRHYIVVFAAKSEIEVNTSDQSQFVYANFSAPPFFEYAVGASLTYPNTSNSYVGKASLVIGSGTLQNNISLSRIVGQLQVNMKGPFPSAADHLMFFLDGESAGANYNGMPQGTIDPSLTTSILLSSADKTASAYQFTKFVANTTSALNVTINCYDVYNNVLASRNITGVHVQVNRKTIITGDLTFSMPNDTGHVYVDPKYSDTTVIHF